MEALDADGNVLEPFQESEYEIIGIYSYPVVLTSDPHAFVNNLIFVPENSITEDFQDHVVGCGPMQAYNTSFRIKNGSAARFLEEFSGLPESSLLEIEFDDGGYETFASKMNNTRIVLLTAVCGTAGATIGMRMDRAVQEAAVSGEDEFSTAYTKGLLAGEERTGKGMSSPGEEVAKKKNPSDETDGSGTEKENPSDGSITDKEIRQDRSITENDLLQTENSENKWLTACLIAVCETGLVWLLALFCINRNLRAAPILVLSAKEEE